MQDTIDLKTQRANKICELSPPRFMSFYTIQSGSTFTNLTRTLHALFPLSIILVSNFVIKRFLHNYACQS